MPQPCLQALPTELLDSILTYLSIQCLLAFGRTSKRNQASAIHALDRLELAIFPKPIHSMLAFIEASCRTENTAENISRHNCNDSSGSIRRTYCGNKQGTCTNSLYQIGLITQPIVPNCSSRPKTGSSNRAYRHLPHTSSQQPSALSIRTQEISTQNQIAKKVLSSSSLIGLKSLTIHLYNLSSSDLANTIATSFPHLQHLNLNFLHAYINDCTLSARYWRDTPGAGDGTPAWNAFSNISIINSNNAALHKPKLSTLRSLTLRRVSITSTQLRKWIEHNPLLTTLSLEKVRGVDVEFCDWLAEYITSTSQVSSSPALDSISIEDCANLKMNTDQEFNWLGRLVRSSPRSRPLNTLSLEGCAFVNETVFTRLVLRSKGDLNEDGDDDDDDIDMEMSDTDVDTDTFKIRKITSPRGIVFHRGKLHVNTKRNSKMNTSTNSTYGSGMRAGSSSPALTISDGAMGSGYWKAGTGEMELEVDPDL